MYEKRVSVGLGTLVVFDACKVALIEEPRTGALVVPQAQADHAVRIGHKRQLVHHALIFADEAAVEQPLVVERVELSLVGAQSRRTARKERALDVVMRARELNVRAQTIHLAEEHALRAEHATHVARKGVVGPLRYGTLAPSARVRVHEELRAIGIEARHLGRHVGLGVPDGIQVRTVAAALRVISSL